ncbi:MAG TPA: hypothetical protein VGO22_23310 [Pseudorhizobium sp.]|jgi:hypothetical protein|nr:hypothetical protein [Pseudorhizobium sp.]
MPEFEVPYVKRDHLALWHDYWESGSPSEEARRTHAKGNALGLTVMVVASNATEAGEQVERNNPGFVALRKHIRRY